MRQETLEKEPWVRKKALRSRDAHESIFSVAHGNFCACVGKTHMNCFKAMNLMSQFSLQTSLQRESQDDRLMFSDLKVKSTLSVGANFPG